MEYSQIILEMLDRIKTLEGKVKALEEGLAARPAAAVNLGGVSPKYRALAEYLLSHGGRKVTLTYREIEGILGFSLPATAENFKNSFWANTETHSYASSWMKIGYKARVGAEGNTVTFVKNTI